MDAPLRDHRETWAFETAQSRFQIGDALDWAAARGALAELEDQIRHGLACVARARAEDALPSSEELQQGVEGFRYRRGLITADATRDWLAVRELPVEALVEHVRLALLRERYGARIDLAREPQVAASLVAARLWPELVFSGLLEDSTRALAERVALAAALGSGPTLGAGEGLDPERLQGLERLFELEQRRVLTDDALQCQLSRSALAWQRVSLRCLVFETPGGAREARLAGEHDGLDPAAIADVSGAELSALSVLLEDVEPGTRPLLGSALPGEWLGPLEGGAGAALFFVDERRPASLDDAEVRRRAQHELWRGHVDAALRSQIVRWNSEVMQ